MHIRVWIVFLEIANYQIKSEQRRNKRISTDTSRTFVCDEIIPNDVGRMKFRFRQINIPHLSQKQNVSFRVDHK